MPPEYKLELVPALTADTDTQQVMLTVPDQSPRIETGPSCSPDICRYWRILSISEKIIEGHLDEGLCGQDSATLRTRLGEIGLSNEIFESYIEFCPNNGKPEEVRHTECPIVSDINTVRHLIMSPLESLRVQRAPVDIDISGAYR